MTTTTKSRGMIVPAARIPAMLDGRVTQYRVPVKTQSLFDGKDAIIRLHQNQHGCPFGVPGDRLHIKETWMPLWDSGAGFLTCLHRIEDDSKPDAIKYRADGEKPINFGASWRRAQTMPEKHSRLHYELTDIRVQRVQEITEEDARAEGVDLHAADNACHSGTWLKDSIVIDRFARLWNTTHGPGSWESNPWCWVLGIRRVEG